MTSGQSSFFSVCVGQGTVVSLLNFEDLIPLEIFLGLLLVKNVQLRGALWGGFYTAAFLCGSKVWRDYGAWDLINEIFSEGLC